MHFVLIEKLNLYRLDCSSCVLCVMLILSVGDKNVFILFSFSELAGTGEELPPNNLAEP